MKSAMQIYPNKKAAVWCIGTECNSQQKNWAWACASQVSSLLLNVTGLLTSIIPNGCNKVKQWEQYQEMCKQCECSSGWTHDHLERCTVQTMASNTFIDSPDLATSIYWEHSSTHGFEHNTLETKDYKPDAKCSLGSAHNHFCYRLCHNQTAGVGRAQLDSRSRKVCIILCAVEIVSWGDANSSALAITHMLL